MRAKARQQTLLLIPGMMCDARLFSPQIEALEKTNHINVIVAPIVNHDSIEKLAEEVLQSAPPTFSLGGLSMGGIVAMEVWRQAPQRINKLCLMDTNPLAESEDIKLCREPQIAKVKRGQLREVMRDEMKPKYLYQTSNLSHRQTILNLCMEMALDLGEEVFIRQSEALKNRPDQCQTLTKITCPTLILHGKSDALCPATRHQLMHQLVAHSHYTVIDKAGHLPTLENPQQVNQLLQQWLL